MHIHEVIIDGFKSYATRTVVSGFDKHFNAITGLNGSGKSNILDSICFVLGISNLSQVRVGNLQELVYKQGQAGVTKASVTIVFDNSDPNGSPIGYESHSQITVTRQIVVGGKNKYMINGTTVQQSQVQNLFHSVQLNVNNPHFLIMQGRITKVLNMKPPEILSMIEEAAGTRMFETKKQAALKTIDKKQQKVDEISTVIDNEITPTLERLRDERTNYLQWAQNNCEMEKLDRLCIAYDFHRAEEKVKNTNNEKAIIEEQMQKLLDEQEMKREEAEEAAKKVSELNEHKEKVFNEELDELKNTADELSKELVKSTAALKNHEEAYDNEQNTVDSLSQLIESGSSNISVKKTELNQCEEEHIAQKTKFDTAETTVTEQREKYQNALSGKADESNTDTLSLPEQVGHWEKKVREAESTMLQGEQMVKHLTTEIKSLKKSMKEEEQMNLKSIKNVDRLKTKVITAEEKLSSLNYDPLLEETMTTRMGDLKAELGPLRDQVERLTAQVEARLAFQFSSPEKGFDRNRVKGLVAKLVNIKEPKASTALEIAAGGKLYQVVVDTEQTGKMILQNGKLKKRVTILPLNKLNARVTDRNRVDAAKKIACDKNGTAHLALELVGYSEEVQKAMEYVFGTAIVCDRPDVAEAIAFHPSIRTRTVTLDGDSYDPSGTLTGGSKSNLGEVLARVQRLDELSTRKEAIESELCSVKDRLKALSKISSEAEKLASDLDIAHHELKMCLEEQAQSTYGVAAQELESKEKALIQQEEAFEPLKEEVKQGKKELEKLKNMEKNITAAREKALKELEDNVKKAVAKANECKSKLVNITKRRDLLKGEIESSLSENEGAVAQKLLCQSNLEKLQTEVINMKESVTTAKLDYELAQSRVDEVLEKIQQSAKQIESLNKTRNDALKQIQTADLEVKKLQSKLKQWGKDCNDSERVIEKLLQLNPWIQTERDNFGTNGGDFDFASLDMSSNQKKFKELKVSQEKLAKKINKKVMGMIEKAETDFNELTRKKQSILSDKNKIEGVINELETKKKQALDTTWAKVTRDFGSIFSTLLPGTMAKLEPPEGGVVADGLEVKVAFNGVWKQSLTELSGGQRSLLALSLILSLLLFKPAPMYILDEVDAALDLSHTQNIGLMLRSHFSHSQFVVVSLKEGMFNNANVIFRTKFVDGVSTVSRTVAGNGDKKGKTLTVMESDADKPKAKGKAGKENSKAIMNA